MKRESLISASVAMLIAGATAGARAELPVPPCFPGAIYRKAVSSYEQWVGIRGEVTLPQFHPDPDRLNPKSGRPLDNSSIYIGGRCDEQEIDAGLTWEIVRRGDGSVTPTPHAFRPFWRNTAWYNAPATPDYYYFPGDTIRMSCRLVDEEKLELEIVLLERGPHAKAALAELGHQWVDAPTTLTVTFDAPTFHLSEPREFKRVNAIDQYGNEGESVQATAARVEGALWRRVELLAADGPVAFEPRRYASMLCPEAEHVMLTAGEPGDASSEAISLRGALAPKP
jgi:hypothetical protein